MDIERVVRNTPATLTVTFYTDETPNDADGTVSVVIKRANGTTLTSGNAVHQGAAGSGKYAFNLAPQASLNNLTVDWSGTFSGAVATISNRVEIVGGHYFTIAELRGYDSALADSSKYSTAALADARLAVEVEFERVCHRAFVHRFFREPFQGDGSHYVWLKYPEIKQVLSVNDVAVVDDSDFLTYDGMYELRWLTDIFVNDEPYIIEYEYGMDDVPVDIKRAALRRARGLLTGSRARIDERATVMQIPDFGTFQLSTPGQRGAMTGIPDIDVVLADYALGRGGVL